MYQARHLSGFSLCDGKGMPVVGNDLNEVLRKARRAAQAIGRHRAKVVDVRTGTTYNL